MNSSLVCQRPFSLSSNFKKYNPSQVNDLQVLLYKLQFKSTSIHRTHFHHKACCSLSSAPDDNKNFNLSQKSGSEKLSYLSMWRRAIEREREKEKEEMSERNEQKFENLNENQFNPESNDRETQEENFFRILEVSEEDRRKAINEQMIDRAGAALSAAQSFFSDLNLQIEEKDGKKKKEKEKNANNSTIRFYEKEFSTVQKEKQSMFSEAAAKILTSPGPDFWSWEPPPKPEPNLTPTPNLIPSPTPPTPIPFKLKERKSVVNELSLPLESQIQSNEDALKEEKDTLWSYFELRASPSLPPLQSLFETDKEKTITETKDVNKSFKMDEFNVVSSVSEDMKLFDLHTRMHGSDYEFKEGRESFHRSESGENEDGSRWWKEWGVEYRGEGEACEWTVLRGVSHDNATEWQEKWWEIRKEEEDYSELGAEKSGRDVYGKVWRETWKEAMWMEEEKSLAHIEKSADKWGTSGMGGEWHEKWFEHYDAYGKANKWADKWSKIDLNSIIDPGHAHVWHEKWGEEYDGAGKVFKYTDKWAERYMGEGRWSKWGDKWNEEFKHEHGKKYGETWKEAEGGERWNRVWGEEHDGHGGVHKYGHSSYGEHWDVNEASDLHVSPKLRYGFKECFEHSSRLRKVGKKKKRNIL